MTSNFILDLGTTDRNIVGGKAASLGVLANLGIGVPRGFVITSSALAELLRSLALPQPAAPPPAATSPPTNSIATVRRYAEHLQVLIQKAPLPDQLSEEIKAAFAKLNSRRVAVRSSAMAEDSSELSLAGQFDSVLDCGQEDLFSAIRECWASYFSERALRSRFYDLESRTPRMAVIVQEMIAAKLGGVAFSLHPVSGARDVVFVEALPDTPSAVTAGSVTPHQVVLDKRNFSVNWINSPLSELLPNHKLRELGELVIRVEEAFACPVDVEWVQDRSGALHVLQARPITALDFREASGLALVLARSDWVPYLTRPFNILTVSLVHRWYSGVRIRDLFGSQMNQLLALEHPLGTVRQYRSRREMELLESRLRSMMTEQPAVCLELLHEGKAANIEAAQLLAAGRSLTLEHAVDVLERNALLATILPYFIHSLHNPEKSDDVSLLPLVLELRKESFYPVIMTDVIMPLARERLRQIGYEPNAADVITLTELLNGRGDVIPQRLSARSEGQLFAYYASYEQEDILFGASFDGVIRRLEGLEENQESLVGQVAFPGRATGTVKIIRSVEDLTRAGITDGDIHVSVNCNPRLIDSTARVAAIVTDEGGITCHGAIISREKRIPCIVGTGVATELLRDGDYVEVDAYFGLVRIIRRRNSLERQP